MTDKPTVTPAETGHPETPGYVPGATVTAGAILTAVTIATPAETGLALRADVLADALDALEEEEWMPDYWAYYLHAWRKDWAQAVAGWLVTEYNRLDKEPKP